MPMKLLNMIRPVSSVKRDGLKIVGGRSVSKSPNIRPWRSIGVLCSPDSHGGGDPGSTLVSFSSRDVRRLKTIVRKQGREIKKLKFAIAELKRKNTIEIVLGPKDQLILNHRSGKVTFSVDYIVETGKSNTKKSHEPVGLIAENMKNIIFNTKKVSDEQLTMLRKNLAADFVPRIEYNYEWFAFWRVFKDFDLLRKDRYEVTYFVMQLREWFPGAKLENVEEAINLYKSGYLGNTLSREWKEEVFETKKNKKQSVKGFRYLKSMCDDMIDTMLGLGFKMPKE